ncbi:MAG: hypothetical protein R2769_11865 [Saprospiraceae bacterium]
MVFLPEEKKHILGNWEKYNIPELDLVIVDLYPFEETVAETNDDSTIIEKIDIGGISLIRAAAKNFNDVTVVASRKDYEWFLNVYKENKDLPARKTEKNSREGLSKNLLITILPFTIISMATRSITLSNTVFKLEVLRYGENPHHQGVFYGDFDQMFEKLNGKAISYNNLVDIDAAVNLMKEFVGEAPTFAILKHTNACGVAQRDHLLDAWKDALACDSVSAFGGIFICNHPVDLATAQEIDQLFYEVLIAPDFNKEALELLSAKKNRILLKIKHFDIHKKTFRSLLNGVVEQDADLSTETRPTSKQQLPKLLQQEKWKI